MTNALWVRELLRCPVSGGELVDAVDAQGAPELHALDSGLAYPVRDGIPILLAGQARALTQAEKLAIS